MPLNTHISASVTINSLSVCKNGQELFKGTGANLQALLVAIYQHFQFSYTRFYKMDNLSKLGWLASEVLLKDSFDKNKYQPYQTGIVLSNANSSLDSDVKYMASVADIASPALFVYTLPNIMMGEISIRNNFKGESALFISPAFNPQFIEQYVNHLFNNNIFESCICGWVDVLGNNFKAILFLVEKGGGAIPFTAKNMEKVFTK
ncbi:hypothetical protein BDD43_3655 [Mucilaginibacter gracilis]|uniref:Beta-ketoacyl synthase-like protein n=1 Tax=Mucilaginibacter gracilis TaxID=423350 RepID=A0A495J387_9SPHI|nr:hypothetical protein [Mucilaginibacter gracilis]RKR83446.1 hypothetical protein BDD43_3655 [Mucilaginibacter gracilis]